MRRLTQCVLASGCLWVSVIPTIGYGVPQNIAADTALDATGEAEGVNFTGVGALKLTVPDTKNIGSTAGVSVSSSNAGALPQIIFQGSSIVTGSITAIPLPAAVGNRVNILELQGGAGKTVTLNGVTVLDLAIHQVNFTTLSGSALVVNDDLYLQGGVINFGNFGAASTVTFADGVDFSGNVDTNIASTGSVIFKGDSTVTGGVLGSGVNSLLEAKLGSGTVYLNQAGTNKVDTFKFTSSTGTNTLKLANNANITGNIDNTSGTASRGTLLFEQNSTITGNIGTISLTTRPLALIRMSDTLSTVNLSGDVFATTTQLLNSGAGNQNTLNLTAPAATSTVSTNIVTSKDNVGIVQLTKVATFTGDIGSSSLRLNKVEVGANNNTIVNGNIHVNTGGVTFLADKTLTIGAGNFINGSVLGVAGVGGKLEFAGSSQSFGDLGRLANKLTSVSFNGGTFNLNNTPVYATDVFVNENTTLVFNQNTKLDNNLNLNVGIGGGDLQLGSNTVTVGNTLTSGANSLITLNLSGSLADPFGNLQVTNQADFTFAPIYDVTTSGFVPSGTQYTIVTAAGGFLGGPGTLKNPSTLLSNFTITSDANNVYLNVTRNSNASISEPLTYGIANALDSIQNNNPELITPGNPLFVPNLFDVINQLDNFTDSASFNEAIATLAPSVDGDNREGMMAITRLGVETIRERLDNYRLGQLDYFHTGYAAGSYNPLKDYGVWVKLLASRLKQTEYKGVEGYKSDIWGIGVGADYTSPDNEIVYGLGFIYANTESLSRTKAASTKTIDSYSLMLYGTYNFNNPWYLDGILYLTNHDYDQTRNISVGSVLNSAKAKYGAWQLSARAETGFVYQYNKVLFQPILSLFYSHLDRDNYTEQDATGLNLVVRPRDINSVVASIGPKISTVLGSEGASIIPELHAYYNLELTNSKEQYQSNFVVGGPVFETDGIEPKRSAYIVGVGLAAYGFENLSCHVNLNYEFNETKFSAFHGSLKFQYTW
jgi:outer membrane autotransporter protein